MKKFRLWGAMMLLLSIIACSPEPQPVNYGKDLCHFCKMTIVDKAFSAEIVTKKGRVYKFDAIECEVNYLLKNNIDENSLAYILVADYSNPGNFIDAKNAYFIISPQIQSPMGANLAAVSDAQTAQNIVKEKFGTIYRWNELKDYFAKQKQ